MSGLVDFGVEPDVVAQILALRLATVHASGHVMRWRVVCSRDVTVGELLRTLVVRSQAAEAKLGDQVILVELMHNRLYRVFEQSARLDRLRRDDLLAVYEVPDRPAPSPGVKYLTVACHARLAREPSPSSFFEDESDQVQRSIAGIPLLFRVPENISEHCLYSVVRESFYSAVAGGPSGGGASSSGAAIQGQEAEPFALFCCEHGRSLSEGGTRLDPTSEQPAGLARMVGERSAALLAVEWPAGQEPAPWVLRQVERPLTEVTEAFLEVIVGVDVVDLCRQTQQLRAERQELLHEVADLRQSLGRFAAAVQTKAAPSRSGG